MCMSPHEMTSAHIEGIVESYRVSLADENLKKWHNSYAYRMREFEGILKERAEDGTYDTAGYSKGDRHETQRTAYQGV